MMKDVIISISGEQGIDSDSDTIELTTVGRFGEKNGSYYLTYDETEMLGMGGAVKTGIYIKPDKSVVLQRTGAVESRLVVEQGKRSICCYYTSAGELLIGIFGERVKTDLTPKGGEISMKYTIDSDLRLISRNSVKISVREVK